MEKKVVTLRLFKITGKWNLDHNIEVDDDIFFGNLADHCREFVEKTWPDQRYVEILEYQGSGQYIPIRLIIIR